MRTPNFSNDFIKHENHVEIIAYYKLQSFSVLVDHEDFDMLVSLKRRVTIAINQNNTYYATIKLNGKILKVHRLVMKVTDPKDFIDHIDHNTVDNRRSNLRITTNQGNSLNRIGARSDSKTGYLGVTYISKRKRYHARVSVDGKRIYIGYFATAVEAAEAVKNYKMNHVADSYYALTKSVDKA